MSGVVRGFLGASPAPLRELLGVPAPAKLNWFLHVTGRRDDGLHELQTVFQFIDWCDEIDFELRDDGGISREGGEGLPDDDLCVRAARALRDFAGCRFGVHMRLRKHIPAQAGLGGGSSDAASVLLALNRLWGLGLRRSQLQALGEGLGADVPVFVFGRNAFAEGVGTRLRELELPRWRVLVAWPGAGLSTAQVFGSPALTRDTPACTMEGFCKSLKRALAENVPEDHVQGDHVRGNAQAYVQNLGAAGPGSPGSDFASSGSRLASASRMIRALDFGVNDLQRAASQQLPLLQDVKAWLEARCGSVARMSGSGSAMFAPWPGSADEVPRDVPRSWSVRVCSALNRHPLLDWAPEQVASSQ